MRHTTIVRIDATGDVGGTEGLIYEAAVVAQTAECSKQCWSRE